MKNRFKYSATSVAAVAGVLLSQVSNADIVSNLGTLDFGTKQLGSTTYMDVDFTNNGVFALGDVNLSITGYQGAFFVSSGCGSVLFSGQTCTATIGLTPDRNGQFHNRLNIDGVENDGAGNINSYSATVKLEGATAR